MNATTHTEIYRRLQGELRTHRMRFWAIAITSLRVLAKRKLPMLLLYVPVGISCIVFSFVIHSKFMLESGQLPLIEQAEARIVAAMAGTLIQVSRQIAEYTVTIRFFAFLAIAWYGSGLIAEDRRLGAHLLYFSRPITRLDYLLGKFFACAFHGCMALLVPVLVICGTAAFSSPQWSFVTEEGEVIVQGVLFSLLWVTVASLLVLCLSSLVNRKSLTLAAVLGFGALTELGGIALTRLTEDHRFLSMSVFANFERIGTWIFGLEPSRLGRRLVIDHPIEWAFGAILLLSAACFAILLVRLRKLEVVG